MLQYFRECEQKCFVSDETQHNIDYIMYNVPSKKYTEAESFFSEDNKVQKEIDIPCCRLNRH